LRGAGARLTVVLILTFCGSCDRAAYRILEEANRGTTTGVSYCVKRLVSDIVSADLAKKKFVSDHEREYYDIVIGKSGYENSSGYAFYGTLWDQSPRIIVTSVLIEVEVSQEAALDGQRLLDEIAIRDLWIGPNSEEMFNRVSRHASKLKPEVLNLSNAFSWSIAAVYGLRVD